MALCPGQLLFIRCETVHRRLALAIAEAAYDLGAAAVDHSWSDPLEKAMLVRRARPEAIAVYHQRDQSWFNEVVRTRSPVIMLVGEEFPQLALVARDSPIARSGLFFDKFLLDENAASHVALGRGFPLALAGGESMSALQLEELGCNHSKIHTDIIFGSPEVSIAATRSRHGEVVLVDRGEWARWAAQEQVEGPWPLD